jgi:mycothiol synthase
MHISTAAPADWLAAFELALQHLSAEQRPARVHNALSMLSKGAIDPGGIFLVRAGSALRGVQVCISLPGASGLFWLPKSKPHDPALEERLVQHALDWLRRGGAKLAQAILSPLESVDAGPLLRRGFRSLTSLHYFEHPLQMLPPSLAARLHYCTYSEANRDVFHATLQRTYEGTLDCPELNGMRTLDEVIAGHKAQGEFHPERWWLAFEGDNPIGVAIMTDVPDLGAWDLSYVGLVPAARRQGLGRELVGRLLHFAHKARAPKLLLAVDRRNQPALQLYRSLGFVSGEYREVYLHFWDGPLAAAPSKASSPALI